MKGGYPINTDDYSKTQELHRKMKESKDEKQKFHFAEYLFLLIRGKYRQARCDEDEPFAWITVHGNRIPLDAEGNAIGGRFKGQSFKGSLEYQKAKYPPKGKKLGKLYNNFEIGSRLDKNKNPKAYKKLSEGENFAPLFFSDSGSLSYHYEKHAIKDNAPAYKGLTEKQYLQRARDFLTQPVGGDILGYVRTDGEIVRFNKVTCEFAAGYPNGNIATLMIAKVDKETGKLRPKLALKYYEKDKREKGI